MKTIYLARHAKSSWDIGFTKDFDRPLNKRGTSDVIKIGIALRDRLWRPACIIASPAMRVKQTCEGYCEAFDFPLSEVVWNKEIYEAYTVTLLQVLTHLDENTNSVMLLGHNPAMEDLLIHLCGISQLRDKRQVDGKLLTTGNIAKLSFDGSWENLASDESNLEELLRPKGL